MIAKFVFIIFVLFLFMLLFSLGSSLIAYLMSPSKSPLLVRGQRSGGSYKNIAQDPNSSQSQVILRSNNEATGIEYTWSVWLLIEGYNPLTNTAGSSYSEYDHIFHKGNNDAIVGAADTGIASVNNSPGLYVRRGQNKLYFVQDVVSPVGSEQKPPKTMEIDNIPLKKWFHVSLRLKNRVLDAYVNGQIANRVIFKEIPKQNYEDVHIGTFNGFRGKLADLRYFDRALSVFEINSIVSRGPNLAMNDDEGGDPGEYDYLSSQWYDSIWKTSN